jgi:hypothetical protein
MKMNFNIGELHPNTPHLFADLAELLVIVGYSGDGKIHKNDLESILLRGPISHEEIDDEESAEKAEHTGAERNNRVDRQLEDLMSHLSYRASALKPYYPFSVVGEEVVISDVLTSKQRVYRFLLACSRLRSFGGKGIPQRWAKSFAKIGKVALQGLLPAHAKVRIFDANSDDRRDYYTTDLRQALKILGADLGVLGVNEAQCDAEHSSGDAGLDLVGLVNFDDGAATSFAILGQCGAQETGWPRKTLEAHPMRFRNFYQMQFDYPGVMFTPVCFRTSDGEWSSNQSANGIILADRGRILSLLDWQNIWDEISDQDWFKEFEEELAKVKFE